MSENRFETVTTGILQVVEREEKVLLALDEQTITERRNAQNRSIKQILGHLIDSASNNHQRMVRLQYGGEVLLFPDYRQDNDLWIALQDYQHASWPMLVGLWKFYNLLIVHIIGAVDSRKLQDCWFDFEGTKVTLDEMIVGYLDHLNLHVGQIHDLADR